MYIMFIVMIASFLIAGMWNSVPVIKNTVHLILDPTAGFILDWNKTYGMLLVVAVISLVLTLVQKYGTDQATLRELKKEQKLLQEEMKKFKDQPEKILELNKKQMEMIPKTFDITMKPLIFTFVPFILFFRWFQEYFLTGYRFFGFLSWFWFYILFSIVFSSIFRKILKVA